MKILSPYDSNRIFYITIEDTNDDDIIIWIGKEDDIYSIKMRYHFFHNIIGLKNTENFEANKNSTTWKKI